MGNIDYQKLNEITIQQEELLRFDTFSSKIAYDLGRFITDRMYERGLEMSVCIRRANGCVVYQHLTEKTAINNENWMLRKYRTVTTFERCSMGCWATSMLSGETLETHGLNEQEYVFGGGGFPIRLKTGELVGVALVSNQPHQRDHQFLVECLADFLQVKDVPSMVW